MTDLRNQSNDDWLASYEGKPARPVTSIRREPPKTKIKDQGPSIVLPDDANVLIPEGWYVACCLHQKMGNYYSSAKLTLYFKICEGAYSGTKLDCNYNFKKEKNEEGEFEVIAGKRGHYVRMLRRVFGGTRHADGAPVSPEDLVGLVFKVEVATVKNNHERNPLDAADFYSKVKTNIELKE